MVATATPLVAAFAIGIAAGVLVDSSAFEQVVPTLVLSPVLAILGGIMMIDIIALDGIARSVGFILVWIAISSVAGAAGANAVACRLGPDPDTLTRCGIGHALDGLVSAYGPAPEVAFIAGAGFVLYWLRES